MTQSRDVNKDRALDMQIAVEVMGYVWRAINKRRAELFDQNDGRIAIREGKKVTLLGYQTTCLPAFSTSIADAFQVVETMRRNGWICDMVSKQLIPRRYVGWSVCFYDERWDAEGEHDSLPTAICLAALNTTRLDRIEKKLEEGE